MLSYTTFNYEAREDEPRAHRLAFQSISF